jgi:hypothetical protein
VIDRPRRDLWTPLAGVVFVILFVASVFTVSEPDTDSSDARAVAWFADHGHRLQQIVATYLLMFAGAFLLWFVGGLRSRLALGSDPGARVARIAYAGGVLAVGLLWVSALTLGSVALAKGFGGKATLSSGDVPRFFAQLGYAELSIGAMFGAIVLIDATSVLILRTRVLPRWLAWLGFAATIILLLSPVFIPMLALLVWVLAASYCLWRYPAVEAEPAIAAATPPSEGSKAGAQSEP